MTHTQRTDGQLPSCAVVVVNWNGAGFLFECLDSLRGTLPPGIEVIVVDNASSDGSPEEVRRRYPEVVLVQHTTNRGFAAGVNSGLRATAAEVVLLLNNDAVALPGWFEAMVAPLRAVGGSDVGAVTGRVLLDGSFVPNIGTPRPGDLVGAGGALWTRVEDSAATHAIRLLNSTGNEITMSGNGRDRDWLMEDDGLPAPMDVFGFNGGCAALRRAAVEDVGQFDESYFLYYEDTEMSWRLRRRGWRVVHAPDAVTVHRHGASAGTASRVFHVENTCNRLRTVVRHGPWNMVARAWVRSLARAVLGGSAWQLVGVTRALTRASSDIRLRRAIDRAATVPRSVVAGLAVPDGGARRLRQ